MKISVLFFIVFLLIKLNVVCQNPSDGFLLLVKTTSPKSPIVESGQIIYVKTDAEPSFRKEYITRISADTIFFNQTYITINHLLGLKMYVDDFIMDYDLSDWRIIVPPDEVCTSYEMLREFGKWAGSHLDKDGKYSYDDWLKSSNYRSAVRFSPKRQILISHKHHSDFYKIAEGKKREIGLNGDTMPRLYDITRIRYDSIYLNDNGYKFDQVDSIYLEEHKHAPFRKFYYIRTDTLQWEVILPPDSVYFSSKSLYQYIEKLKTRKKRDKFEWRTPVFSHNMIKWSFSRLALLQLAAAYELRFTKKWSVEIEGGYQFKAGSQLTPAGPGKLLPYYRLQGPVSQAGVKYYFNSRGYVEPLVHYNYLVMDSAVSKLPTGTLCLQDQFRNEFGISLRVGQLIRMGSLIIDGYFGLGIKAVTTKRFAYGYYYQQGTSDYYFRWYNDQHIPIENDFLNWDPILSFGIKIGGGF